MTAELSPVSDQAPVLHCPGAEVRDGNHILLRQWVGHIEVVSEVVRDVGADVQGVSHPMFLRRRGINPELGSVYQGQLLLKLKVTDNEASEVGHHRDRLFKLSLSQA